MKRITQKGVLLGILLLLMATASTALVFYLRSGQEEVGAAESLEQ